MDFKVTLIIPSVDSVYVRVSLEGDPRAGKMPQGEWDAVIPRGGPNRSPSRVLTHERG